MGNQYKIKMKSVISLAVAVVGSMAAVKDMVQDEHHATKLPRSYELHNKSCLACLLDDGFYCADGLPAKEGNLNRLGIESKCLAPGSKCPSKKDKGVEIDAVKTKTWVRNCKNIELPFNKDAYSAPGSSSMKQKKTFTKEEKDAGSKF